MQVDGRGSYRGYPGWNLWSEFDFAVKTGTTTESGVREEGLVKTTPPPPGRTETAGSGVQEGAQISITMPPTRTDRYSGAAESEVHKGDQVTKPTPPPTRTDRDSGEAVSGVGVTQGKRKNRSELGRLDSRDWRKMQFQSA